ncbi:hypothetical protein CALVIDRAFT_598475 [Calocera viscosa TUFC12733]|uniref:Uncharacterized protein n=1 Tax=Calocera viscosa (strain TUFC12733) TaxID=1330018 RepID=A0A167LXW2_CALVF|nr:hypothetical protein CALVIDRAFT_598475 [Calocera viscosa TUFC12733]
MLPPSLASSQASALPSAGRLRTTNLALFGTGLSIIIVIVVVAGVAGTYMFFKRPPPPPSSVVWLPVTLARQLRAGVSRAPDLGMSAADAAELPTYAEAAVSPVQTIIDMEMVVRTPSLESREGEPVPPPYEPSVHSLARGADVPARPGLRSRQSSGRVPIAPGPPAGTSGSVPLDQPSRLDTRSRPPNGLRLATPRGLPLTPVPAVPPAVHVRSNMTSPATSVQTSTPQEEQALATSSVRAPGERPSGAGVRIRLGNSVGTGP